jgi:UDP-N-acetylmuramoylalanine--D-glutamate ligase
MIAITTFSGKRVAVLGMARSGLAAAAALTAGGADVVCWDDGAKGRAAAEAAGLALVDLNAADLSGFAALVLSPGVPLTHPEPLPVIVVRARAANLPIIGDTELFFRELATMPEAVRPKVVAITGTNGKSTTTALTAHLLRHAGKRVAMGGNIGEAVLGLAPFSDVDVYVLELSSYQIDLTPTLNPDVGILLNLTPDHLDRHGTMEHYAKVKERLVAGATVAVVGVDDPYSRAIAVRRLEMGKTLIAVHVEHDATRPADAVSKSDLEPFQQAERLLSAEPSDTATLRGPHNAQNAAMALAATRTVISGSIAFSHWEKVPACAEAQKSGGRMRGLGSEDVVSARHTDSEIPSSGAETRHLLPMGEGVLSAGLATFPGLAHRMELLGSVGDVPFVNDSKATNADAAAKALASCGNAVHWIAGGQAKDGGIESLAPFYANVRCAYLIGAASDQFAATLQKAGVDYVQCGTLANAVAAASAAQTGTVLLSPACASFDQFTDFEDRGNQFRRLVQALPGFVPYGAKGGL